jgi:hypothetical protein
MKSVAIVTCRVLPEPDPDQELLLDAIREAGLHAGLLPWDDPASDPASRDLCVMRSCWNYYEDPAAFLSWTEIAARRSRLFNAAGTVRWNHHKSYLAELERAGVPIIPTVWFRRGDSADLSDVMEKQGWNDVVVKPAVSASSFRTERFSDRTVEPGNRFLSALLGERDAMVQKYMTAVEGEGEQAIVWIDGAFTHAVRKSPRFSDGVEQVSEALPVAHEAAVVARKALACVNEKLLYARVDLVRDNSGKYVLSELELIEPSLFLLQFPPALERLVKGIRGRCE